MQPVRRASVTVDDEVVGAIGDGLLMLVGVTHTDTVAVAQATARKAYGLRIYPPDPDTPTGPGGQRSAEELRKPVLVVSQFTLYGDTRKGRRPSWTAAAPAEIAEPLVNAVVEALRGLGATVATGRFGAHMLVESVNVGPQTILIESGPT